MNRIPYDGSGELWISDIRSAREEPTARFDRVVTVCQDSIADNVSEEQEYDFFCMSDGPDNSYGGDSSYEMFEEAADVVRNALIDSETVLVHCHMGQSRSTAVSMAALGRLLQLRPHEAYGLVRRYRIQANPDRLLYEHMKTYVMEEN